MSRHRTLSSIATLTVAALTLTSLVVLSAPSSATTEPTTAVCSDPPPPGNLGALTPQQIADHYGITPLREAGFDGSGLTAAVIETGDSVDPHMLAEWQACMGVPQIPVDQTVIGGGSLPPAGDEAQADAQVLTSVAPGIGILHVLIIPRGKDFGEGWVEVLEVMLGGSATGGRPPDIVSMSVGQCESLWAPEEVERSEQLLQELAEAGTWFLKSAGDAGSSDCAPHGDCPAVQPDERRLATEYPTTSSWMTAVGGTEFVDGDVPVVWFNASNCAAGGGGTSELIERPSWQSGLDSGGAIEVSRPAGRLIPDLSALAGKPGYIVKEPPKDGRPAGWVADGGTSLATPAYAAGFAIVRQALLSAGITPPVLLNPTIYRLATDPTAGTSVFTDVTSGTNDLYDLGCCVAGPGFDLASGWGEVDFTALHEALGGRLLVPRFTG